MSGGVVRLECSPRVAPGLLSRSAWRLLEQAPAVYTDPDDPQAAALSAAGIPWHPGPPPPGAPAGSVWVTGPAGPADATGGSGDPRGGGVPVAQVVQGSTDLPGAHLLDAVAVMDRLRSPGGCPWDAAQTHASLMPYLLEEAYEAYEALETGDDAGLAEELGDLLLQVLFHARIAAAFSVDDVADGLVAKLVRRHPHVFAGATVNDPDADWDALKRAEKGRRSVTEGVPMGQPALRLAATLLRRAHRAGLEVAGPLAGAPAPAVPPATVTATGPRPGAPAPEVAPPPAAEEIGAVLLATVATALACGVDPEQALRDRVRALRTSLRDAEAAATRGSR